MIVIGWSHPLSSLFTLLVNCIRFDIVTYNNIVEISGGMDGSNDGIQQGIECDEGNDFDAMINI